MWKIFIITFLSFNIFGASKSSILEASKDIFKNKSSNKDVKVLSDIAKKELRKSKSDDQYYLAYDLVKTLDITLAMKTFDKVNCTNAKVEIFTLYGVKQIENYSNELPNGALLGIKVLEKICKDSVIK